MSTVLCPIAFEDEFQLSSDCASSVFRVHLNADSSIASVTSPPLTYTLQNKVVETSGIRKTEPLVDSITTVNDLPSSPVSPLSP